MKNIEFTASLKHYFLLWLKNLALELLTFGVWWSWAKVQHRRYFSESTLLLGDSFAYHARGLQLFLGQLIVVVLTSIASLAKFSILFSLLAALVSVFIYTWAANAGWRFRTRNISWRGVRLSWHGKFSGMLKVSLLALLSIIPFVAPIITWYYTHYVVRNLSFGQLRFKLQLPLSRWYLMSLKVFALFFLLVLVLAILFGVLGWLFFSLLEDESYYVLGAIVFSFIATMVLIAAWRGLDSFFFYQLILKNLTLENEQPDRADLISFSLNLDRKYFAILFTNILFSTFTLGIFTPCAQLRLRRYILEKLEVIGIEQLGEIFDQQQEAGSAVGEELSEDLAFGVGFLWWR